MLPRAHTAAGAGYGSAYPAEGGHDRLRRAKSMSSTLTQYGLCPAVTRSDNLTEQERQNQARAAAAAAFKNDLLRRSEPGIAADGTPFRRPSVHFEPTPSSVPDYNPYAFLKDEQAYVKFSLPLQSSTDLTTAGSRGPGGIAVIVYHPINLIT